MSLWSDCGCTFLSSETQIQLCTTVHCVSSCTRHGSVSCASFNFHVSVEVFSMKFRCKCYFPSVALFLSEEMTPFLFFVCSCPQLYLSFFPPLFSHLICSSFCWTLPCPSPFLPLFSLTAPLTTPLSSTTLYHPPPLPLLFSFLMPHAKVYHSPGRPSSHHDDKRSVSDGGQRGTCCGQCVLKRFTC